ncbi:uncharacterized protein [Amphiura filiformis]|uniref:uncharacterized protein n=1 Tax=Amphiura filiformis TaxID=82378 RepID=UPI003B215CB5
MFLDNIKDHKSDKQIFQAITKWLTYDWAARKQHAHGMLNKLHLNEVSTDDLKSLLEENMSDVTECKELLEEAIKNLASKDTEKPTTVKPLEESEESDEEYEDAFFKRMFLHKNKMKKSKNYSQLISKLRALSSTKTAFQRHRGSGLKTFQSENTFCDVTIRVASKSFPAHKNILAASSGYFKTMFTSGFQEAEVSLDGDGDIFEMILDCIYAGDTSDWTTDNIIEVLNMAFYLKADSVVKCCNHFLELELGKNLSYSVRHSCGSKYISLQQAFEISQRPEPELFNTAELAKDYMTENFTYLSKHPDFLDQTTTECMETFLETYCTSRSGHHKERTFEIVTMWVNHDLDQRKQVAKHYLKRFEVFLVISSAALQEALSNGMKDIPECKIILEKAIAMNNKTMSLQQAFEISQWPEPELFNTTVLAKAYINKFNFIHLSKHDPDFLDQTTTECMETFLQTYFDGSEYYSQPDKHRTLEIVTKWVNYNLDQRKHLAVAYLKKFKLHELQSDTLQVALDWGMKYIPECKTALEEVIAMKNKTMSLQQAFEILQCPENELSQFAKFVKKYMEENLTNLSKQPDFLDQTTAECMESVLTSYFDNTGIRNNSYSYRKEKDHHKTFEIVTSWVNHDLDQRKQVAVVYLKKFELHLFSSDALQKALDDGMKYIPECKTVLEEAIALINKTMSLQQAFEILQRPENKLSDFAKFIKKYMEENFTYLSKQPDFLDQTKTECMESLVKTCFENTSNTTVYMYYRHRHLKENNHIFEPVTRWVNHDLDHRKQLAINNLKKFKLHKLPSDMLQKALDGGIRHIPECKTILEEAIAIQTKTMSLQRAFEISQRPIQRVSDMAEHAQKYIKENFTYLSKQPDFLDQTTTECMENFLQTHLDYNYSGHKEKDIFEPVTRWVNHDLDHRKQLAIYNLKKFKLHKLPSDMLQKALDGGIRHIPECKTILEEAIAIQTKTMSLQRAFEISQRPIQRVSDMAEHAQKYIKENFTYLSKQPDFLDQTTTECMENFLQTHLDYNYRGHKENDETFEAVTRWVNYDLDHRKQLVIDYLEKFKLHMLQADILQKALDGGIRHIPECKTILEEVIAIQTKTMSLQRAFEISQQHISRVSDRAQHVKKYMEENFTYLSKQPDFLDQTTTECMEKFLQTYLDHYNYVYHKEKGDIFETVTRWVNHDLDHRKQIAINYLEKFKLHRYTIPSDTLQKAFDGGLRDIPECKTILEEAIAMQTKTMSLQRAFEISQQPIPQVSDMAQYAKKYMEENFTYLSKQPDFLDQTTTECMENFLQTHLDYNYRGHKEKDEIFETVTRWVNHDLDHRKQLAINYLEKFKLHRYTIPAGILQKAFDGGLRDIPECKTILEEVIAMETKTMSLQRAFVISQQPIAQVSGRAQHAKKYMEENFTYLSKQPDFLDQTTTECMENFLQTHLDYNYRGHKEKDEIFETVTRWVNHDLDHRKQLAIDYLEKFKLHTHTIPAGILQKAFDEGLRDIPECKTILEEVIDMETKTMSLQRAFEISQHPILRVSDRAKHAKKYMEENFTYLSKQPDFLDQTTTECMETLLKVFFAYNTHRYDENDGIFEAVTRWINHDLDQRKQLAIDYLPKFKLYKLQSHTLQKALDGGMKKIPEFKTILQEVIARTERRNVNLAITPLHIEYSQWFGGAKEILIHIGGKSMPNNNIRYYTACGWKGLHCIKELPRKIRYHSTVVVNGHLCVAGGMGQSWGRYKGFGTCLSSFYCYDSMQRTWKSLASMTTARAYFVMVHMDGLVYAIGGKQNHSVLSSVERYSLVQESWQSIAPLAVGVTDPSAITYKGKILVYGMKAWYSNRYVLQIFSPDKTGSNQGGSWSIALDDQQHATRSTSTPKYVLTVQNDKVYRITYEDTSDNKQVLHVCVTELQCDFDHEPPCVHIGATEDQAHLHTIITSAGPNIFSINRELYANVLGCIYKTGIADSDEDVMKYENMRKIRQLALEDNAGCVTLLTIPQEEEVWY